MKSITFIADIHHNSHHIQRGSHSKLYLDRHDEKTDFHHLYFHTNISTPRMHLYDNPKACRPAYSLETYRIPKLQPIHVGRESASCSRYNLAAPCSIFRTNIPDHVFFQFLYVLHDITVPSMLIPSRTPAERESLRMTPRIITYPIWHQKSHAPPLSSRNAIAISQSASSHRFQRHRAGHQIF